jgi:hypothetical protein
MKPPSKPMMHPIHGKISDESLPRNHGVVSSCSPAINFPTATKVINAHKHPSKFLATP